MKIISLFLIGILIAIPFFIETRNLKEQLNWESAPKKNGPVIRFMQKYPIIAAVLVGIPLIYILYKWREAVVANSELTASNQSCIWREQHLILQLLTAESKLEEQRNFINTLNDRLHPITPLALSAP